MPPPRIYILIRIHFTGFGVLSSLRDRDFRVLEGFCGHRDFKVFKGGCTQSDRIVDVAYINIYMNPEGTKYIIQSTEHFVKYFRKKLKKT